MQPATVPTDKMRDKTMKRTIKKSIWSLIIVTVFTVAFVQAPTSCAISSTKQETARAFLENVVELDVAKYEITLRSQIDSPADGNGVIESTSVYHLKSEESTLDVTCIFRNNILVWCNISPIEGSPVLNRPPADTLNLAKRFLDNYQNESKASYIQPLRNMLNNVNELKPLSVTSNDVKLTVIIEDYQYIEWMEAPNGITNTYNRVILIFRDGALKLFSNSWNRYPIGSANISVSEEQAISLAKERVKSYSYDMGDSMVSNLTVNEESNWTHAELTMEPRGDTVYPQWEVYLPLDRVYPGMVTSIRVRLWADTGEIIDIHESSLGGMPQEDNSNTAETETPPPSGTPFNDQTPIQENAGSDELVGLEVIAGIAIAVMIIAVVAVAAKKRKH